MKTYFYTFLCLVLLAAAVPALGAGTDTLTWRVTAIGGAATDDFNPYLLSWGNYGKTPMGGEALADGYIGKDYRRDRRLSWSAGFEGVTGWSRRADYAHAINPDLTVAATRRQGMPAAWIQQLWAGVKFRGVYLQAGMRETPSPLVDNALSSGDLVSGSSARPVAQVRAGFIDFQNIPFTRGWAQVTGTLAYGKMFDNKYLENHYNYWNGHINLGALYVYRNIAFRSNPAKPLSVMIGTQVATQFGGTTYLYERGELTRTVKNSESLKTIMQMVFPKSDTGADGYYDGSTLGSWDFRARYALRGGHEVSAYFQWLWEDGSSMGRRNKWDGLWGLQYRRTGAGTHILRGAVAEYIDFRDQSGPVHWAPGDHPGTDISGEATGADDYYNNSGMNAYSHFGMSMGTPFIPAPIYNTDGQLQFRHTRARGFHLAAEGDITARWAWKAAVSHARAWGTGRIPAFRALCNTSALVQAAWKGGRGLSATGAVSFDAGKLRGNTVGVLLSVSYTGNIALGK